MSQDRDDYDYQERDTEGGDESDAADHQDGLGKLSLLVQAAEKLGRDELHHSAKPQSSEGRDEARRSSELKSKNASSSKPAGRINNAAPKKPFSSSGKSPPTAQPPPDLPNFLFSKSSNFSAELQQPRDQMTDPRAAAAADPHLAAKYQITASSKKPRKNNKKENQQSYPSAPDAATPQAANSNKFVTNSNNFMTLSAFINSVASGAGNASSPLSPHLSTGGDPLAKIGGNTTTHDRLTPSTYAPHMFIGKNGKLTRPFKAYTKEPRLSLSDLSSISTSALHTNSLAANKATIHAPKAILPTMPAAAQLLLASAPVPAAPSPPVENSPPQTALVAALAASLSAVLSSMAGGTNQSPAISPSPNTPMTPESLLTVLNAAMASMGKAAVAAAAANVLTADSTAAVVPAGADALAQPLSQLGQLSSDVSAMMTSNTSNDFCTQYRKRIQQAHDRLIQKKQRQQKQSEEHDQRRRLEKQGGSEENGRKRAALSLKNNNDCSMSIDDKSSDDPLHKATSIMKLIFVKTSSDGRTPSEEHHFTPLRSAHSMQAVQQEKNETEEANSEPIANDYLNYPPKKRHRGHHHRHHNGSETTDANLSASPNSTGSSASPTMSLSPVPGTAEMAESKKISGHESDDKASCVATTPFLASSISNQAKYHPLAKNQSNAVSAAILASNKAMYPSLSSSTSPPSQLYSPSSLSSSSSSKADLDSSHECASHNTSYENARCAAAAIHTSAVQHASSPPRRSHEASTSGSAASTTESTLPQIKYEQDGCNGDADDMDSSTYASVNGESDGYMNSLGESGMNGLMNNFSDQFGAESWVDTYKERRRKNNEAAKRSRDTRRAKEDDIALRAAILERENLQLKVELAQLKQETAKLRCLLYSS